MSHLSHRIIASFTVACLAIFASFLLVTFAHAQSDIPDWQEAAGGKLSFETASVKQNLEPYPPEGTPPHSNFSLDSGDAYALNGGLFSTIKWPLYVYIGFAYKLTPYADNRVFKQLPKWAQIEHFDIQARAQGAPTKDRMRLMMQSLLADRFKLAVHTEIQKIPVFELVQDKPGKSGPNLQPHSTHSPCATISDPSQFKSDPALSFPCGSMSGHFVSGRMHAEGRALTMRELANYMKEMSGSGLDRPVLDHTGLTGTFDFTLDWIPPGTTVSLNGANVSLDETGMPFVVALKQQLGLKLDAATGPVGVLIIDHVEEPSPN